MSYPFKRRMYSGYKGGTRIDHGYIKITMPEHPRADGKGYVLEHVVNWERLHCCPVPNGYIVHHKNFIKTDNDASCNLILMTLTDHVRLHALVRWILTGTEGFGR